MFKKPLKKGFKEQVQEVALKQPGKKLEIWLQDEMRAGLRGTVARVWGLKGARPRAPRQQGFEWAYTFGAVCPAHGKTAAVVMPYANIEAMNVHLREISRQVGEDAHGVVVVDRAGWHMSERLATPANLSLLPLPPYSPELNPVELIWEWIRRHFLSNRVYEGYEEIVDVCCEAWTSVISDKERLRSTCWFNWIKDAETL
jgi:transposase